MAELIAVRNLKTYFPVRRGLFRTTFVKAVDDVSFVLDRGHTLALVGESGSGKTTLGRTVLGLIDSSGGSVLFDGEDVRLFIGARRRELRRRAQAVFQDPYSSVSPYMTVYDIVEEPLLIHGPRDSAERRMRVMRGLASVKLEPADETARKHPHNLSGGQRQRVCIARAIVLEPEFIVADEPVSMVDASNRAEILSLLRELQVSRGISFLYITHDIANARHFSDKIAVMYLGTIVERGPVRAVVDGPLHPYTRGLLASVPEPNPGNRKRLRAVIPGEPPNAAEVPPGCPFHPRCGEFMKGTCDAVRPGLTAVESDHDVACFLFE